MVERIVYDGTRSANVHLLIWHYKEQKHHSDGAIRDNFAIKLQYENLSVEISRWYLGK